ncbi:hypothetical protein C0995_006025 [Termitomyces sp. Mi166|nr:hypothetical protein C0995_006025 [Termitomyces sp. Mi166\
MASKISLLNVSPDACLLERELAAQKFIIAADTVFLKAQGLATLAPLHKTAFGLLKGLLDDWRQLNLMTIEWLCKAEVRQACINIWSLNKQAPWAAEFGKTVVSWEHAISTIEQIKLMHFEKMAIELELSVPMVAPQPIVNPLFSELSLQEQEEVCAISGAFLSPQEHSSQWLVPRNKGKGKAKATEEDDNDEETAQKLRKELEDFVVPTTFDDKLLVSLLPPPSEYFEGDSGLPQGAKISGGQKGDITLVSPATRALVLEKNGACDRCIADNMADHCWYPTGERPCWRCYRKSKGCLWNGVGVRTQKKRPPLAALVMAKCIKLVQAAKAFLEQQGKPSQFFILEGYKGKGKAKALVEDSEPTGAKQSFKSRELVDSNSDKEEEEDRVHAIKKIKCEHIEELTGIKRRKEIMELDNEVEIVASKIPAAGPSRPASKPIVLVPSASKFVPKLIVMLASPLAGPSTAPIASSSTPKLVAAAALSKPAPAKSVGPAVKGGSIFKDPFIVRHFKLVSTEESGVLIINQVTEVPATQGTLYSEESGNEDAEGDNDDSNGGDVAMNVDSAKQPEETRPVALIKTVTEVKAPASGLAPALLTKLQRTPFLKLHCTAEHFLYLPLGLQAPIQFEQNRPSMEQW